MKNQKEKKTREKTKCKLQEESQNQKHQFFLGKSDALLAAKSGMLLQQCRELLFPARITVQRPSAHPLCTFGMAHMGRGAHVFLYFLVFSIKCSEFKNSSKFQIMAAISKKKLNLKNMFMILKNYSRIQKMFRVQKMLQNSK